MKSGRWFCSYGQVRPALQHIKSKLPMTTPTGHSEDMAADATQLRVVALIDGCASRCAHSGISRPPANEYIYLAIADRSNQCTSFLRIWHSYLTIFSKSALLSAVVGLAAGEALNVWSPPITSPTALSLASRLYANCLLVRLI